MEMRSHAAWYVKGLKGATFIKRQISHLSTKEDLIELFNKYVEYIEKGPE